MPEAVVQEGAAAAMAVVTLDNYRPIQRWNETNCQRAARCVATLPAGPLHRLPADNSELTVIAYHTNSDFGPPHEVHPMLNHILVSGHPLRPGAHHEVS